MQELLSPAFSRNNVAVFCSTDSGYVPYCYVMLRSLIEHSNSESNYDLIILEERLTPEEKETLSALAKSRANISVRFINVSSYMQGRDFNVNGTLTLATWYRIFAPSIFRRYEKIVYLDVDIIVLSDIARLYNVDLGENWVGGYTDLIQVAEIARKGDNSASGSYYRDTVGVKEIHNYVNAGVLVFNIQQMLRHDVEQKCIDAALKHRFGHHDQDTINHVCHGHVHFLNHKWNVFPARGFEKHLPDADYRLWRAAVESPDLVHYVLDKPWQAPMSDMASYWWKHAALTPYYEALREKHLSAFIGDVAHYSKLKRKYWYYKLRAHLTFGKKHTIYNDEKRDLRRKLNAVRDFITHLSEQR